MISDPSSPGTWSLSTRFQVSSDALAKTFDDDRVALVHMKTQRTHVLNPTAAMIWKCICAGNSRGEIRHLLLETFDVDENELLHEIDNVLSMLKGEDLIHLCE